MYIFMVSSTVSFPPPDISTSNYTFILTLTLHSLVLPEMTMIVTSPAAAPGLFALVVTLQTVCFLGKDFSFTCSTVSVLPPSFPLPEEHYTI